MGSAPVENLSASMAKALQHLQRQQFAEAVSALKKLLSANSKDVFAWYWLGIAYNNLENYDLAEKALINAIALDPRYFEAYMVLGEIYDEQLRYQEAVIAFQRAIKIRPENSDVYVKMGNVFYKFFQFQQAEQACQLALKINPQDPFAWHTLAKVYTDTSRFDAAEHAAKKAIEIDPEYQLAYNTLASMFNYAGSLTKALETFREGIEKFPQNGVLPHNLTYVKSFKPETAELDQWVKNYENIKEIKQKITLGFAIARAYEKLKEYDKAFEFYQQANDLHFANFNYDYERYVERLQKTKATFPKEFLNSIEKFGDEEFSPIFIVGMPRSGTSLTEQILSSHSKVQGGGELDTMPNLALRAVFHLTQENFPTGVLKLSAEHLKEMAAYYRNHFTLIGITSENPTDKLPGNFIYVGLIKMLFPKARIIFCKRDAMDNCLSIYKQCFYGVHNYGYDLDALGKAYRLHEATMHHWKDVLPEGSIFDLHYEDMVNDTEGTARKLLEFCGLEWEDACLNFHESSREVRTASIAQVREPIYKGSVGSWKKYEKHLKPLVEALGERAI